MQVFTICLLVAHPIKNMDTFIPIVGSEFSAKVVPILESAKRNIDIVVYDWRFYPERLAHPCQLFNRALIAAVRRGVIVRAVVNNAQFIDTFKRLGIQVKKMPDKRVLHSKMIIVDRETLIIGSHNYTSNGMVRNIETSLIVSIPEGITRFADFFENLYNM